MHAVAAFFASIITFVSGFFAPTVASNSPVDIRTTQPAAAAATQTEITGDPFNDPTAASAVAAASATVPPSAFSPPPTQTVINQPVIEHIIERIVPQGTANISTETLTAILSDFEESIASRIAAINPPRATIPAQVAAGGNTGGYYFVPASQRIDQLTNTTISNPAITGGSITNTSIVGTIANAIDSALGSIGDLTSNTVTATNVSFANATTTNLAVTNLTASATSTLSGLKLASTDCSAYGNGGKLTTDAFGIVVCAADQGGGGGVVGGLNTQIQFNDGGVFGGSASLTFDKVAGRITFPYASTTAISANTLTLATPLAATSGGTGTTTQVTNGVNYFDGTRITSGTALSFNGTTITAPLLSLSQTSGTSTIASGQGFSIGSSQFVLQQGSGNVGIGTSSPSAKLNVAAGTIRSTFNFAAVELLQDNGTGFRWALDGAGKLYLQRTTNSFASGVTNPMVIDASGNVGISSTTPSTKFSVGGNGYFSGGLGIGRLNTNAGTLDTGLATAEAVRSANNAGTGYFVGVGDIYGMFSSTGAYNYTKIEGTGSHSGAKHTAWAAMVSAPGSGTFGASSFDATYMSSLEKTNYLTSTTEGELDSHVVIVNQGRKGDTGAYIAGVTKVFSDTADDTGGAASFEFETRAVDPSGTELRNVHTLSGFIPSHLDAVAGTSTYGFFAEGRTGSGYAAYYAGSLQQSGPATGWKYVLVGTDSRTTAGHYFKIVGDTPTGTYQAGDIIQGRPGSAKILRTESGTFKIRNEADNSTLFAVTDTGNVGVGTSTPTAQLHTTGTVRFSNFGAGALQTDANGNVTVSSDERLKNVQGAFAPGLAAIMQIDPILYRWKPETGYDASTTYAGFSAQNVQTVIPEAVGVSPNGYLSLSDRPILAALVNAVKEIVAVTGAFKDSLIGWLGNASNGIGDIFAQRLCLTDASGNRTCIDQQQLAVLLAASQSANSPTTPASTIDKQAPVLELNGNASSTVEVGDTYNDLGARIVAPESDLNLGVVIVLDGATTTQVSIDTSMSGEHIILYTVTSPTTGLTGSAMRTVIVSPAELSPAPAEDTNPFNAPPSNDNASSTAVVDVAA